MNVVNEKKFLTGQRVVLNRDEIATIVRPKRADAPNTCANVWVFSPLQGYASYYSTQNVEALPGGQL